MAISDYLSEGRENARTGKELCNLLHITMRDLTAAVERERRNGRPICAATGQNPGYYLAKDRGEMQAYCASLWRRGGNLFKTRRACMETIEQLPAGEGAENEK